MILKLGGMCARKNVLLCPPKDPKSLADAIDLLMSNPEVRLQLNVGALELAREWFTWEKAVMRTIETFQNLGGKE